MVRMGKYYNYRPLSEDDSYLLGELEGVRVVNDTSVQIKNGVYIVGQAYCGWALVSLSQTGMTHIGGPQLNSLSITIEEGDKSGGLIQNWIFTSGSAVRLYKCLISTIR